MTKNELNKYKALLEAKQAELAGDFGIGKELPLKRRRMRSMKSNWLVSGSSLSGPWTANRFCCATCGLR